MMENYPTRKIITPVTKGAGEDKAEKKADEKPNDEDPEKKADLKKKENGTEKPPSSESEPNPAARLVILQHFCELCVFLWHLPMQVGRPLCQILCLFFYLEPGLFTPSSSCDSYYFGIFCIQILYKL